MDTPVRILNMVGAMYPGGMENFIMNLYRHIDRERFQFDFAVNLRKENDYTREITEMGGRIYDIARLNSHPFRNLQQVEALVRGQHYPIVIRHTANAYVAPQLSRAKTAGAITICHSHNETDPRKFLHYCGRIVMHHAADERLACSENAGRWMYGKDSFRVIHNAIDIRSFSYDSSREEVLRREFGLADDHGSNGNDKDRRHVYGNIANFIASKNHPYLLKIYREIVNREPDALCLIIGEGEERPAIEAGIRELGLEKNVILTGIRRDVPALMSLLDVLVFPSVFEGLPLTLIEAQAAALPSLISDTITKDVIVTRGIVTQMSIQDAPAHWAAQAVDLARKGDAQRREGRLYRVCPYEDIAGAGYDIEQLARWYEGFFEELLDKRK